MTAETAGFWGVAAVLLVSSLGVVLTPNLFHAVLYLAAALVSTGGVFLLLRSPFLFGVQLLLYAGGVVTIVVFAIMLTERIVGQRIRQASRNLVNGAIVAVAVFVGIAGFLIQPPPPPSTPPTAAVSAPPTAAPTGDAVAMLGQALVGRYALPLELLGVLLVVSLLGALHFARPED